MIMSTLTRVETDLPKDDEIKLAQESSRVLSKYVSKQLAVNIAETGETVQLPLTAVRLLVNMLGHMAEGNAVTVIPVHAELTTQQAADYLGVSRPFLIGLLEDGELPYHMVGTHRRIYFRDLKSYSDNIRQKREKVLDALVEDAIENNMGY